MGWEWERMTGTGNGRRGEKVGEAGLVGGP